MIKFGHASNVIIFLSWSPLLCEPTNSFFHFEIIFFFKFVFKSKSQGFKNRFPFSILSVEFKVQTSFSIPRGNHWNYFKMSASARRARGARQHERAQMNKNKLNFFTCQRSLREASGHLVTEVRSTLQKAQEVATAVETAEKIAEEAARYCDGVIDLPKDLTSHKQSWRKKIEKKLTKPSKSHRISWFSLNISSKIAIFLLPKIFSF